MRIVRAALVTDRPVAEDGAKLRGFFGRQFADNPLFHHHEGQGLVYRYPKVQYKVIGGRPIVVGVDDAADAVAEAARSTDRLWLMSAQYKVEEVMFEWQDAYVGPSPFTQYEFVAPWLALNERNNEIYKESRWRERKRLLGRIVVGNVLSMCKGLDVIVDEELFARTRLDARTTQFKGVCLTGFLGEFQVNFRIPDLLGIGKGVSQGFGTVACNGEVTRTNGDQTCIPLTGSRGSIQNEAPQQRPQKPPISKVGKILPSCIEGSMKTRIEGRVRRFGPTTR